MTYPDAGLGHYLRRRIRYLRVQLWVCRQRIAREADPVRRGPLHVRQWEIEQRLGLLAGVKRDFEETQREQQP